MGFNGALWFFTEKYRVLWQKPRIDIGFCCFCMCRKQKRKCQVACKPGSVPTHLRIAMTIHLGLTLLTTSSDRPEWQRGNTLGPGPYHSYLVLLPVGFTMPRPLLDARCALTAPFHPYPARKAVCFLWHFP